ncbi:MAG: M20/M25/M40 family metallo-hydrolase [Bacteroidota bacterium]|nr:M20/M25/M40 family metallo-hydrolase [Bacteroidota bacterium]
MNVLGRFSIVSISALFFLPIALTAQVSSEIGADELREHVTYLASDELAGRRPGTPGALAAAEYVRDQFRAAGLRLLGEDGMQHFSIVTGISAGAASRLAVNDVPATLDETFTPLSFSASTGLNAGVVCVGYGFDYEADSSAWRDYAGREVDGTWVLILRGSPDDESGDYDPFSSLRKKALVARDHGAGGVLFAAGPLFDEDDVLVEMTYQQQEAAMDIPVLSISRTLADALLEGRTVAELEKELNAARAPLAVPTRGVVNAEVEMVRHTVDAFNVVGMIEGTDPALAEECLVLGAHYDHLGMGGPGSGSRRPDTSAVHNGADDNASGTAAIIEIAERIAADPLPRSVVVVAFTAEEMGLLGSKHFAANPPADIGKAVLMCNLDMVGRMREGEKSLSVGGTGTADGLADLVEAVVTRHGFTAKMSPEGYGPSDHAAFYTRDIPVLFFFTGVHEDYHTPDDDADRLNYAGGKLVADVVTDIVTDVARRQEALAYTEAGPKSRPSTSKRFKVTLGIMPDVSSSESRGLRADAVMPDRPADRAGMKKGDVIVAMEGKPVDGVYQYMDRLSEFKPGQRISVEVLRDGEKVVLIVEL